MIDNRNVYVEHWVVFLGKRRHKTISRVVGIGHECVYVSNRSHTGHRMVRQEDLIRLVRK